ncbi:MAG: hypothetical protein JF612_02570 [Planctomycetia bacterium]|nr:hypothetical protein [Planctomycetia bacterium]
MPAFLYAALPHTACICADGHREEHCRVLAGQRCDKTPAASASAAGNPAASTQFSCCKACQETRDARSCCPAKESQTPQTGLMAAGQCCHPVVEAPAPLVLSAKAAAAEKSTLVTAIAPITEPWFVDTYRPIRHSDHLSTPPPLDVVIVYLHLTI